MAIPFVPAAPPPNPFALRSLAAKSARPGSQEAPVLFFLKWSYSHFRPSFLVPQCCPRLKAARRPAASGSNPLPSSPKAPGSRPVAEKGLPRFGPGIGTPSLRLHPESSCFASPVSSASPFLFASRCVQGKLRERRMRRIAPSVNIRTRDAAENATTPRRLREFLPLNS